MDFDTLPIISPKPSRTTQNSFRVKKINSQSQLEKSANSNRIKNDNYDLQKVFSCECLSNIHFNFFEYESDKCFEKKIEEDIANNEIISIINRSNFTSPNQTPSSKSSLSLSFYNSGTSCDTLNFEECTKTPTAIPTRTKNPYFKSFESSETREMLDFLDNQANKNVNNNNDDQYNN